MSPHSSEGYHRVHKSPRPDVPSRWHSLPSAVQDCPRDDQRIERSGDTLFLAVVLKHFKPPIHRLKRLVVPGTQRQRYFLERADGALLNPVTLEEARPEDGWILSQSITTKPLRRRMREQFFAYRRALSHNLWGHTVIVNGVTLIKEGDREHLYAEFMSSLRSPVDGVDLILDHPAERKLLEFKEREHLYAEFMDSLRWPLHKVDDLILDHLAERKFLDFEEACVTSPLDAICPLDGPVRPLVLEIVSPRCTWADRCGRHWAVALCPHCLGEFASKLLVMN